ncbi:MAG: 30S ribosomal protein S18 [Rickettsiales bacterium]|jgi:small subunit ribosomal protein S18|nr:30S ribosomal protein S18 [Rickettsiales bacterium]
MKASTPDMKKKVFFRRFNKGCPLTGSAAPEIDYKDTKLMQRFISARGRILPRRITGVCASKHRKLVQAIKTARVLAMLPYSDV